MEAKELRIGNHVNFTLDRNSYHSGIVYTIDKKTCNIHETYPDSMATKGVISIVKIKVIEPVKLTEDWLLKIGFKKINRTWFKIKTTDQKSLSISLNNIAWVSDSYVDVQLPTNIEFVHQLQNLYFALTR